VSSPPEVDFTSLLAAARGGDRGALARVYELVYAELKRIASRQRGGFGGVETLSTTAIVHEAYLKLAGDEVARIGNDRTHFFALAARAMRQVLIDHTRHRRRQKRGAGAPHIEFDLVDPGAESPVEEMLALEIALERLGAVDPELERLVEWRFFGGLTLEEIAPLVGLSERTIKRQWRTARAFLLRELGSGPLPSPAS